MRLIGAGTRAGFEYTIRETFWTVPNVITVVRFLLIPLFIWFVAQGENMSAFGVLALLSSTDWVDGYIARRFDQMSTVGQWLDPLADRLSMVLVALTLVAFGIAPVWLVLAIAIPDLVLFINAMVLFRGSPELRVSLLGKIRTACLMIGAPLILLGHTRQLEHTHLALVAEVFLAVACALHVVAAVDYFVQAHRKARGLRAQGSAPTHRTEWALGPLHQQSGGHQEMSRQS